ncbi:hypothetical protein SAMN04488527_110102 [Aliiroseovarius crassostreae]|nr:hypothetical protein SAMN04488527_110102 [Aliiroseovarius crassostreae]
MHRRRPKYGLHAECQESGAQPKGLVFDWVWSLSAPYFFEAGRAKLPVLYVVIWQSPATTTVIWSLHTQRSGHSYHRRKSFCDEFTLILASDR